MKSRRGGADVHAPSIVHPRLSPVSSPPECVCSRRRVCLPCAFKREGFTATVGRDCWERRPRNRDVYIFICGRFCRKQRRELRYREKYIGFCLNVAITLKVCRRLACGASEYDRGGLIAVSKGKTHTPTHGCVMSICHQNCPYSSRSTDFSRNVMFSGNKGAGTKAPISVSVTRWRKSAPASYSE